MVGTSITRRPVWRSARVTSATALGVGYTLSCPALNWGPAFIAAVLALTIQPTPQRPPRGRAHAGRGAASSRNMLVPVWNPLDRGRQDGRQRRLRHPEPPVRSTPPGRVAECSPARPGPTDRRSA